MNGFQFPEEALIQDVFCFLEFFFAVISLIIICCKSFSTISALIFRFHWQDKKEIPKLLAPNFNWLTRQGFSS